VCLKTRLGGPITRAWAESFPCEARFDADRQYVERRGRMEEVAARVALRCMIGVPLDFTISAHGRHNGRVARISASVGERVPPVKRPMA
jgi:hypothetical protein